MSDTPAEINAHLGFWLRLVSNAVSNAFARRVEAGELGGEGEGIGLRRRGGLGGRRHGDLGRRFRHRLHRVGLGDGRHRRCHHRLGHGRLDQPARGAAGATHLAARGADLAIGHGIGGAAGRTDDTHGPKFAVSRWHPR